MDLNLVFDEKLFDNGFSSDTDYFGLDEFGTRLTNLLLNLEAGSSLVLDGKWGTGKTHFARLLKGHLKQQNIPVIYFNAFEHDHMVMPFEAICSAITKATDENIEESTVTRDKFLRVAGKVGKGIAFTASRIGIRLATAGALDLSDLGLVEGNADKIADAIDDAVEKSVQASILSGAVAERTLLEFREELGGLRSELGGDDNNPLVVIIDELDRCRPDFSIGVLESIKHFFGISKVHFLLVTNLEQMEAYTDHLYGTANKSAEYLSKFFDVRVSFPPIQPNDRRNKHEIIVNNYFDGKLPAYHDGNKLHYLKESLSTFAKVFNLSIRTTLKVCATAYMSLLSLKPRFLGPPIIIAILCVLKEVQPELYKKAASGLLKEGDIHNFLKQGQWEENTELERYSQILRWHVIDEEAARSEEFQDFGSSYAGFNVGRTKVIPLLISSVIELYDFQAAEE